MSIYRGLAARGMGPVEAANLTAFVQGLRPVEGGWTIEQISRLAFLRYLAENGRI